MMRFTTSPAAPESEALLASSSKVPSFALFEFVTPQSGDPPQANNAKGGSCVVEAGSRLEQTDGTGFVEAAQRFS
jgi:hypothetical protein